MLLYIYIYIFKAYKSDKDTEVSPVSPIDFPTIPQPITTPFGLTVTWALIRAWHAMGSVGCPGCPAPGRLEVSMGIVDHLHPMFKLLTEENTGKHSKIQWEISCYHVHDHWWSLLIIDVHECSLMICLQHLLSSFYLLFSFHLGTAEHRPPKLALLVTVTWRPPISMAVSFLVTQNGCPLSGKWYTKQSWQVKHEHDLTWLHDYMTSEEGSNEREIVDCQEPVEQRKCWETRIWLISSKCNIRR